MKRERKKERRCLEVKGMEKEEKEKSNRKKEWKKERKLNSWFKKKAGIIIKSEKKEES